MTALNRVNQNIKYKPNEPSSEPEKIKKQRAHKKQKKVLFSKSTSPINFASLL